MAVDLWCIPLNLTENSLYTGSIIARRITHVLAEMLRRSGAVNHPEMQEALDDVVAEAERMTRLVSGLLALARADAGQEISHATVRLDEIVELVQREVQSISGSVSVELAQLDLAEIEGDADALKQLLLILVDNGMKYTPPNGKVTLSVQTHHDSVLLEVRDTGPGIAAEDLPNIFERFYRSATSRGQEGTGLGLAIARWIAEAHGGSITVSSPLGEGACFTITFPRLRSRSNPSVDDEVAAIHTARLGSA